MPTERICTCFCQMPEATAMESVFRLTAPDNENSDCRTPGGLASPQGGIFSIHWK